MTTRSIILSPHEVRAALDGRLGLVVRPVKPQPDTSDSTGRWSFCVSSTHKPDEDKFNFCVIDPNGSIFTERGRERNVFSSKCPLGVPGDRLRCKESWADVNTDSGPAFTYRADNGLHFCQDDAFPVEYDRYPGMSFAMWCGDLWRGEPGHTWRRAQHMPAWASRITLEVVRVRCVRVRELTEDDAKACGMTGDCPVGHIPSYQAGPFTYHFAQVWEERYAKRGLGWETDPWAWEVEVRRVEG